MHYFVLKQNMISPVIMTKLYVHHLYIVNAVILDRLSSSKFLSLSAFLNLTF